MVVQYHVDSILQNIDPPLTPPPPPPKKKKKKKLSLSLHTIQYLLNGLAWIDIGDWKRNTDYTGYQPHDQVIVWFWKAVENYDNELRSRLLQFVTGTSKVPMNGFSELQGSQGPRKFCIKRYEETTSLPRAHTW